MIVYSFENIKTIDGLESYLKKGEFAEYYDFFMKKIPESFIKNISEFLNDLNQIKSPSVLHDILFNDNKAKKQINKNGGNVIVFYKLLEQLNLNSGWCLTAQLFHMLHNQRALNHLQLGSFNATIGMENIIDLLMLSHRTSKRAASDIYIDNLMRVWDLYVETQKTKKFKDINCLIKLNYLFNQTVAKKSIPINKYIINNFKTLEQLEKLLILTTFGNSKKIQINLLGLGLPQKYLIDVFTKGAVKPSKAFNLLFSFLIYDKRSIVSPSTTFHQIENALLKYFFQLKQPLDIENFNKGVLKLEVLINFGFRSDKNMTIELLVKILMQNPEKTNLVFNLMESQGVEKIFQSEIITKLSILDKKFNKNVEELDVKEFECV